MASHHPIRKVVASPTPVIPDKLYFRIGDVSRLCEVPAYVLRFWETEFPNLKPNKGGTGQRLYRRKDVETALRIKHLLYDLGYTIPGARQVFKSEAAAKAAPVAGLPVSAEEFTAAAPSTQRDTRAKESVASVSPISSADPRLLALRDELRALHQLLSRPVASKPAMRPRLVLETRPRAEAKPEPRPGPIVLPGQQDLFPSD